MTKLLKLNYWVLLDGVLESENFQLLLGLGRPHPAVAEQKMSVIITTSWTTRRQLIETRTENRQR